MYHPICTVDASRAKNNPKRLCFTYSNLYSMTNPKAVVKLFLFFDKNTMFQKPRCKVRILWEVTLVQTAHTQQTRQKVRKKVFNWQRFICAEITSYKIHILTSFYVFRQRAGTKKYCRLIHPPLHMIKFSFTTFASCK